MLAEARYGGHSGFDDIRRVCAGAVSIPFAEYVAFLSGAGYLRHDDGAHTLEITEAGEEIVNGKDLGELTNRAVAHFKNLRERRRRESVPPPPAPENNAAPPPAPAEPPKSDNSSASVGGVILSRSEVIDGRYQKIASLGSGGIGTVFRARQVALGREVALKQLNDLSPVFTEAQRDEVVRRFAEVARQASGLSHPNILAIHDASIETGAAYVVAEYAPGGSARRLIADAEEIPPALALRSLIQGLKALRTAHTWGVIHRGLTPENLLFDAHGNVKISDFGFSRILARDISALPQVYVGVGKVAYMAPELLAGGAQVSPSADIYALGIIFYELLTRSIPGRRSPMPSEVQSVLPKGIDDIFDRMTADQNGGRYPSADEALEEILHLEGLAKIIGLTRDAVIGDNPLSALRFRHRAPEPTPVPADPIPTPTSADRQSGHRPYSYKQRKKR
ncbi:MAG TPA: serine/threonine-protein kinase [Kofleriaceae bacterium]|nr:serine/threonine-protein kinase [Kofleriaceae bacterium]